MPSIEMLNEKFEQVYRAACYACHNQHVAPYSHGNAPAEYREKNWVHPSSSSITGFIVCYASRYRKILHPIFHRGIYDGSFREGAD